MEFDYDYYDYDSIYDTVMDAVDKADAYFESIYESDPDKVDALGECCDMLDKLTDEFQSDVCLVGFDDKAMEISVCLKCSNIVAQSSSPMFYDVVARTTRCEIKANDEDSILFKFVFPSVWNEVKGEVF